MATYVFDMDGTLVTDCDGDYEKVLPKNDVIDAVNSLYDHGHTIIVMTARGMTSKSDKTEITRKQLSMFGVKYHTLIMNAKPKADYYVDDKAINVVDWMRDVGSKHA